MSNDHIPASFRADLKLYAGPPEEDGSPTYNLYDPVKAKYYKISWKEHIIYKLARPGLTVAEINELIKKSSTIHVSDDDVADFFKQAGRLGLLNQPLSGKQVEKKAERGKTGFFKWLIFNYLYIRLPLFSPDRFLSKTLHYVTPLWSVPARLFYLFLLLCSIIIVATQWDSYWKSLNYFFSWEGIAAYLLTVFSVKIVHELSHAYTAKRYGIHVSTMGVAFIILYPVLYTDVTHSWTLSDRRHRLAISIAGVISELVVAVIATCLWAFLSPGILRSACFLLSSTSWVLSVFVNFNPIMRFDGYYMLADYWGVDNLRGRSFALGKWKWRQWLFGTQDPCPEEGMGASMQWRLVVYAYASWVYLFFLYSAIALVVYHKFTKSIGVILFSLEILVFFIWPVVDEVAYLMKNRGKITMSIRFFFVSLGIIFLAFWAFYPLQHRENFPGVVIPDQAQYVYAPEAGILKKITVSFGDRVEKGQLIVKIVSSDLEKEISVARQQLKLSEEKYRLINQSKDFLPLLLSTQSEIAAAKNRLNKLIARKKQLTIYASLDGEVYLWNDKLRSGEYIKKGELIGKIADLSKVAAIAYVPEKDEGSLKAGQPAVFRTQSLGGQLSGTVVSIDRTSASTVLYPALTSEYGGPIMVHHTDKADQVLVDSYYEVKIRINSDESKHNPIPFGKSGTVSIMMEPRSLAVAWYRWLLSLLVAESTP
ncbi:MAG: efflux RND transporter periplasmic adaptor subunit [Chlamydiales bacterium]|nr:efflux RND transporter periplasmic adaptor subunit [Chlamydiia bacterium]MCP5508717.1 efflux RND transporter periplasmic adaptor subunit [Chlamydiales bacterium]